jgi:hypothetical protein
MRDAHRYFAAQGQQDHSSSWLKPEQDQDKSSDDETSFKLLKEAIKD